MTGIDRAIRNAVDRADACFLHASVDLLLKQRPFHTVKLAVDFFRHQIQLLLNKLFKKVKHPFLIRYFLSDLCQFAPQFGDAVIDPAHGIGFRQFLVDLCHPGFVGSPYVAEILNLPDHGFFRCQKFFLRLYLLFDLKPLRQLRVVLKRNRSDRMQFSQFVRLLNCVMEPLVGFIKFRFGFLEGGFQIVDLCLFLDGEPLFGFFQMLFVKRSSAGRTGCRSGELLLLRQFQTLLDVMDMGLILIANILSAFDFCLCVFLRNLQFSVLDISGILRLTVSVRNAALDLMCRKLQIVDIIFDRLKGSHLLFSLFLFGFRLRDNLDDLSLFSFQSLDIDNDLRCFQFIDADRNLFLPLFQTLQSLSILIAYVFS